MDDVHVLKTIQHVEELPQCPQMESDETADPLFVQFPGWKKPIPLDKGCKYSCLLRFVLLYIIVYFLSLSSVALMTQCCRFKTTLNVIDSLVKFAGRHNTRAAVQRRYQVRKSIDPVRHAKHKAYYRSYMKRYQQVSVHS